MDHVSSKRKILAQRSVVVTLVMYSCDLLRQMAAQIINIHYTMSQQNTCEEV